MNKPNREYGYCIDCGYYVYRLPGYLHGDGQLDTEDRPVWLLADEDRMTDAEYDQAHANEIHCGCFE